MGELELGRPLAEHPGTGPDQRRPHALAHAWAPWRLVMAMHVWCRSCVPRPTMFEEILMSSPGEGA
ncbi:MAG TPA: hypothetical protein VIY26_05360 [Acidimicrobiales bacterium]